MYIKESFCFDLLLILFTFQFLLPQTADVAKKNFRDQIIYFEIAMFWMKFYFELSRVAFIHKKGVEVNVTSDSTCIWRKSHRSLQPGARQFFYGR